MNDTYTSLSGEKVLIYPEEKVFTYPKDKLQDLLSCPISLDWNKNPVIYNGIVYDYDNIKEWLDISKMDPLTREEISGEQKFYPFNLLKFIIYAMEEDGDMLKFHSPPNSVIFAHDVGFYLPVMHYQNNNNHMEFGFTKDNNSYIYDDIQDISCLGYVTHGVFDSPKNFKNMSLDRFVLSDNYQSIIFENCYLTNVYPMERVWDMAKNCKIIYNIHNYDLIEYLFTSQITGKQIHEDTIYLSDRGQMIDDSFLKYKGMQKTFTHGSYYINRILKTELISIKNIMSKFQSALNYQCSYIKIFDPSFENFRTNGRFQTRCTKPIEFCVDIESYGQKIYKRLEYIKKFIKDTDKEDLLKMLSNKITNDSIKDICNVGKYFSEENMVNKFKKEHGIPFIVDTSRISSPDLGLLFLNQLEIKNSSLKYLHFSGASLNHTTFTNCQIDNCCFTGCDLTTTKFINCRIVLGKLWYKTKISPETFDSCKIIHENNFEQLARDNHLNIDNFEMRNQFFIK